MSSDAFTGSSEKKMNEPAAIRDAATVILLRDVSDGIEVFMVQRHGRSGFMAGAHVFPGGKVDPSDCSQEVLSLCEGRTSEEAARALGEVHSAATLGHYVAAARETFEEAGVLFADVTHEQVESARGVLSKANSFAASLASTGANARLRLDWLAPWARWITPEIEPRRFDTRFFIARLPAGQRATLGDHESTSAEWMSPRYALERETRGEILLPPPTLRNLELLTKYKTSEEVMQAAARMTPPLVKPIFKKVENGEFALVVAGDPEHPDQDRVLEGPTRLYLRDGRWWAK